MLHKTKKNPEIEFYEEEEEVEIKNEQNRKQNVAYVLNTIITL